MLDKLSFLALLTVHKSRALNTRFQGNHKGLPLQIQGNYFIKPYDKPQHLHLRIAVIFHPYLSVALPHP